MLCKMTQRYSVCHKRCSLVKEVNKEYLCRVAIIGQSLLKVELFDRGKQLYYLDCDLLCGFRYVALIVT